MKLTVYTNIPNPYNLDFFEALAERVELRVVYYSRIEADRQWSLPVESDKYAVKVLRNAAFMRPILRRWVSFHFSWEIVRTVWRDPSEMVIVSGSYLAPNSVIAMGLARLRGKRVAFWGEPLFPAKSKWKFWLKYLLFGPVRWWCDVLFSIGKRAAESFRQYGAKQEIINMPYNIDPAPFQEENLDTGRLQDLYAQYKPNGEVLILTSGSLTPRKGMDTLIRAFRRLPPDLPAKLLIMGDGPQRSELEALAAGADRIHFLGFQEKSSIPYFFRLADIFAFATRYDGWAVVINEAIAAGCVLVSSTAAGAAYDLIEDGQNGLLFEPEDEETLAQYLLRLVEDPDFRKQLAEATKGLVPKISSGYYVEKFTS